MSKSSDLHNEINLENQSKDKFVQTYTSLATNLIGDIHNTGISTKILQFMQKVRNNSDERYALRWVSELLQNTRDCAYEDQGVKILIELLDDKLVYKHNSKPFRVKDILSLINQVTSKVDDNETTGKFGTGFMTTMLLSDVVNIKSILQDKDLPYKPFEVDINRSPETSQEIVNEINKSISQLYKADENKAIENFNKNEYNTTFTYELKNDKNRNAAMTGIQNLNETIYYIFAFSDKYRSIQVSINTKNKKEQKEFVKEKETKIADNTYEIVIKEDNNKTKKVITYKQQKENVCLAIMVDENKNVLPIGDKMPKIFISFPLIGSENFPFPIVINCQDLQPNETRSNIALVENEDSTDSKINKEIINKSVGFYEEFLEKLIELNYQNLENFIKIAKYKEDSERAEKFVKRNIYQNLYSIIKDKKIIKCNDNQMRGLNDKDLYIIYDEDMEIRKELKQLVSKCENIFYPIEPDNWKENLDGYEVKINNLKYLEDIVSDVDKKNNEFINIEENELVNWLYELYKIVKKKPELYKKLIFNEYKFFPCQEREIFANIKYCREIRKDPGISDNIKNIIIDIDDNLNYRKRINLKQKLLSKSFNLDEDDRRSISTYDVKKIDQHVRDFLRDYSNEEISKRVLCVKKESQEMINLMNLIKENNLELIEEDNDSKVDIISNDTIDVAIKNCLDIILSLIEKYSKLEDFANHFLKDKEKCFEFLNKFYDILKKHNYSKFNSSRIIPNCKGEFKKINELFGNKIEEDELYSIYKKLGKTFDDSIIHKEINLDDLSKCYTDKDVAKGIEEYYIKIFVYDKMDINRESEDIKAISIGLFDWMEKNEEKVQNLMQFFKNKIERARLLDLTVVNQLHEKSKFYDEFSKFFKDEEEFKNFLKDESIKEKFINFLNNIKSHGNTKIIAFDKVYFNFDDLPIKLQKRYKDPYDEDFQEFLKKIGDAGENAAYEYLIKDYEKKGFIQDDKNNNSKCVTLTKTNCNDSVKIKLCNNSISKQPGYDIEITIKENGVENTKYVEVKTHTSNSNQNGKITLSFLQYYMSIKYLQNYSVIIMKAKFNGDKIECELSKHFDPFLSFVGEEVRPENRGYIFEFDE